MHACLCVSTCVTSHRCSILLTETISMGDDVKSMLRKYHLCAFTLWSGMNWIYLTAVTVLCYGILLGISDSINWVESCASEREFFLKGLLNVDKVVSQLSDHLNLTEADIESFARTGAVLVSATISISHTSWIWHFCSLKIPYKLSKPHLPRRLSLIVLLVVPALVPDLSPLWPPRTNLLEAKPPPPTHLALSRCSPLPSPPPLAVVGPMWHQLVNMCLQYQQAALFHQWLLKALMSRLLLYPAFTSPPPQLVTRPMLLLPSPRISLPLNEDRITMGYHNLWLHS